MIVMLCFVGMFFICPFLLAVKTTELMMVD